jgi:Integrase core domain
MLVPFAETLHSDKPGEILHFDFRYMGPSLTGELYALILKDDASMYTWLIAAKRADADTAVNALMQWKAAFGTSTTWISDQASHFKCEVINKLGKALRVLHAFTPAYTPRANGTVEAVCKQVLRSGRALLADFGLQPDQWPEVLPLIQSVLNNSVSTGWPRCTFGDGPPWRWSTRRGP